MGYRSGWSLWTTVLIHHIRTVVDCSVYTVYGVSKWVEFVVYILIHHIHTVVDCGPAPVPTNGQTSAPDGTIFNRQVWYSCSDGYDLVGSESATCLANGQWSPVAPTCRRMYCLTLHLKNSQISDSF